MIFDYSPKTLDLIERVRGFMAEHIYPNEARYEQEVSSGERWKVLPLIEELKPLAHKAGLWNLFLNMSEHDTAEWKGPGLTNLEYAPLCEEMGRVGWSSEVFNCSAPDTGNMEVLRTYGSEEQKAKWLRPLMDGKIRSAFLMTEPAVASSDATNIETSIRREGDEYVINGRKWWSSGRRRSALHHRHRDGQDRHVRRAPRAAESQVLVPLDAPGITKIRALKVFGYDDAPHGHYEVLLENVRVPVSNVVLREGAGFEIAQGRLGPGRIHHCMRSIGAAERALEKMCKRLKSRTAFGKPISEQGVWHERIADSRIAIEQARLLTLKTAYMMDTVGNKAAKREIAMIKVVAPNMACMIHDMAIQAHGGGGVCQDYGLASGYAGQRTLRLADGPDEVHRAAIAKDELRRYN